MSLLPYLLDELTPASIFDQDFGLGIRPTDLYVPRSRLVIRAPEIPQYMRPWHHLRASQTGSSNVTNTGDEFKVNLDVQQFKPEQLSVKVADKFVVIEGKHEERRDEHGFISRQFTRRYLLPDDVDPSTVQSQLSSDGVLSIVAPKKRKQLPKNEQSIPITHTNQPAIKPTNEPKKNQDASEQKMDQ